MKVLIIIDQFGWAFEFAARGIQKYSRNTIEYVRFTELSERPEIVDEYNCIFFLNRSCYDALAVKSRRKIDECTNKCVGVRGGFPSWSSDLPILQWKVGCVSKLTYNKLKDAGQPKLFYCPNGIDTEIFKPVARPKDRFVVGWVGNPGQNAKRSWMLDKLEYSVLRQSKWGPQYFVKNRSRDEVVIFYSKIDTLICTSEFEGMPQPVLEGMATGLPIVSTEVGGVPDVVDSKWLVPINPESLVIEKMNDKLRILSNNLDLRIQVGIENQTKIAENWGWNKIVKYYDELFEASP